MWQDISHAWGVSEMSHNKGFQGQYGDLRWLGMVSGGSVWEEYLIINRSLGLGSEDLYNRIV